MNLNCLISRSCLLRFPLFHTHRPLSPGRRRRHNYVYRGNLSTLKSLTISLNSSGNQASCTSVPLLSSRRGAGNGGRLKRSGHGRNRRLPSFRGNALRNLPREIDLKLVARYATPDGYILRPRYKVVRFERGIGLTSLKGNFF